MIHCKHCQLKCKTNVKVNCDSYNAIANRPTQLPELIRKAYNENNNELAIKLQSELFRLNHG